MKKNIIRFTVVILAFILGSYLSPSKYRAYAWDTFCTECQWHLPDQCMIPGLFEWYGYGYVCLAPEGFCDCSGLYCNTPILPCTLSGLGDPYSILNGSPGSYYACYDCCCTAEGGGGGSYTYMTGATCTNMYLVDGMDIVEPGNTVRIRCDYSGDKAIIREGFPDWDVLSSNENNTKLTYDLLLDSFFVEGGSYKFTCEAQDWSSDGSTLENRDYCEMFIVMPTSCTPSDGTWGEWGACQNGVQTRTCEGYTCCPAGCTEGVDCASCGTCSGDSTRPCARVVGVVWSDSEPFDEMYLYDGNEDWSGDPFSACTTSINSNFRLTFDYPFDYPTVSQAPTWGCNATDNQQSFFETNDGTSVRAVPIDPVGGNLALTGLPMDYRCKAWSFGRGAAAIANGTYDTSDPGITTCNTNLTGLLVNTDDWGNQLKWEICKPVDSYNEADEDSCSTECGPGVYEDYTLHSALCGGNPFSPAYNPNDHPCNTGPEDACTYTVNFEVKDVPFDWGWDGCGDLSSVTEVVSGATVTLQDSPWQLIGYTDVSGIVPLEIPFDHPVVNIFAEKEKTDVLPDIWGLLCPSVGSWTKDFSDDDPRIIPGGTIPAGDPLPEIDATLGLIKTEKKGWVSSIDADIFASEINSYVPPGLTDNTDGTVYQGFSKALINSSSNNGNSLGFAFSENMDNSPYEEDKVFEMVGSESLGGKAYNLATSLDGVWDDHDSKWLGDFTFAPPTNGDTVEPLSSLPSDFEANKIYTITGEDFDNDVDSLSSYTITGGSGISILYVDGDISITDEIKKSSGEGRLLIVTSGSAVVSADVYSDVGSYTIDRIPNIEAGIVAQGTIIFESNYVFDTGTYDNPIMVSGPLISKTDIVFQRNLGHDTNAELPAQSAKAYNKYLYYVASLEREKLQQDNLYFTGLTDTRMDWEYIY